MSELIDNIFLTVLLIFFIMTGYIKFREEFR